MFDDTMSRICFQNRLYTTIMKLPDPLKIIVIKRLAQETTELIFRVKNDIIMITYKISFQQQNKNNKKLIEKY